MYMSDIIIVLSFTIY